MGDITPPPLFLGITFCAPPLFLGITFCGLFTVFVATYNINSTQYIVLFIGSKILQFLLVKHSSIGKES